MLCQMHLGVPSSITSLAIEANIFELHPALVTFVEKDQFGGRPTDNPHIHGSQGPCKMWHHQVQRVFYVSNSAYTLPFFNEREDE